MEVLCACDERYLPHAATMLCSLLEHNSVSRIHFFYSTIRNGELEKLKSLVARYGSKLLCYEMVAADFQDLRIDRWISNAAYYRLLAARFLPAETEKVLYFDCDIIVRNGLNELWATDLAGRALAAVPDYWLDPQSRGLPEGAKYFNSGVLLINLPFWRQNNVAERAIAFIKNNPDKVTAWDQDALNAILVNQWVELPPHWNAQNEAHWRQESQSRVAAKPAVVHFITDDKPWRWSNKHPFKREYHKYRLKTPWAKYRQEGQPRFRIVYSFARALVPRSLRKWLRARIASSRAFFYQQYRGAYTHECS
jgi:lipopolysaccharide biosynthesis glycosyltransferase